MAIIIGHARGDERGGAHGGTAGDQTGKEVCESNYYEHKKGWRVLRATTARARERIAQAMERACANANIGYDQWQRDTLYNQVSGRDFDPAQATNPCETDCSALVRVCVAYAYGYDIVNKFAPGSRFSTANMFSILIKTKLFEEVKDGSKIRGDILVTKTQGHTAIIIKGEGDAGIMNVVKLRTLKRGYRGEDVRALQILLKGNGCDIGAYGADGDFGAATERAVRTYQERHKLTTDGIVGIATWTKIIGG